VELEELAEAEVLLIEDTEYDDEVEPVPAWVDAYEI
jgi:hypothetical protein